MPKDVLEFIFAIGVLYCVSVKKLKLLYMSFCRSPVIACIDPGLLIIIQYLTKRFLIVF